MLTKFDKQLRMHESDSSLLGLRSRGCCKASMDIVRKVHMKRNCEFVPLTLSSPPSRNLHPFASRTLFASRENATFKCKITLKP